jgi:adenylate cyclase
MGENIQSLFDAIRRGAVRPQDAARYVSDLVGLVAQAKGRLFGAAMGIERDDDALLGQAAAFFGRVYVPVDLLSTPDTQAAPDLVDLALQRQSLPVLRTGRDPSVHVVGIRPSVLPVVRGARGGGFPSEEPDPDGVRRRTRLLAEYDGQHLAQLAFAAVLDLLGNPEIQVSPGKVILHGAVLPGNRLSTLEIPLGETGQMLLNWPATAPRLVTTRNGASGAAAANGGAAPDDGFRHLPWSTLLAEHRMEDSLVADLRDMDAKGYLSYLRSSTSLLDVFEEGARLGRGMLAAGSDADVEQWRAARESFFALCDQFLGGDAETRIISDADRQLQSGALSEEEKNLARAERDRVPAAFADARQVQEMLQQARSSLRDSLAGSFCIVSLPPTEEETGSTVTPFGSPSNDARASAALASTVLSGHFLRAAPARVVLLLAAVLSLALSLAVLRLKPLLSLVVGIAAAVAAAVGAGAVFSVGGLFVPPSVPVMSMLVTGISLASLKLAWKRGASRTVRAAFAGRVSTESLQAIDASRARLVPEGSRRAATVLSLVVKGAAVESAGEDPREVIRRLRTHRAALGEALLGLGGMVVDAGSGRIAAAFGAPVESEDHVRRACLAALRVLALERELNGSAVSVFSSRIGIHTGECVAGFLGDRVRPDYSLVGIPAEIAARLEALNDAFGTSILVSEQVREAAGPGLLVRMLGTISAGRPPGRVRVYELIAQRDGPEPPEAHLIAEFEEALARMEKGDTEGALALFTQLLLRFPGDGPSVAYARRCRRLLEHGSGLDVTSLPW